MYLSRARCHFPVKAWNTSIYLTFTIHVHVVKLGGNPLALMPGRISALELMPGQISRISALELMPGRISQISALELMPSQIG